MNVRHCRTRFNPICERGNCRYIIDEVLEVLTGDYVYIAGRENRWLIIGKTARNVFLTIVLGERPEQNTYGLITARRARRKERSFYIEYTTQKGGEEEDEDEAS